MVAVTKTFKSGNSVAVRLPKELGIIEGTDVEFEARPEGWLLRCKPTKSGLDLVEALAKLPRPDKPWKRERIVFPKRRGLP